MSAGLTFETQISIGCENCAFAKQLNIGRAAVVCLAGVDTSRVPLRVSEIRSTNHWCNYD
jgi:hypothetical protein